MPSLEAVQRINSFDEVALGYSEEQAVLEASRCLNCKKPLCIEGCPVEINIPAFINFIKERKYADAIRTIKEKNNLPAICGRVCPQENQCEKRCVLGKKHQPVAIGNLERFVADWDMKQEGNTEPVQVSPSGKKVAIVGSGPAGLTAAADLARLGHQVTVFEALHTAGGVLVYGIPEFRLPKIIVEREIEGIRRLGVEIKTNMVVGKVHTVDELMAQGYAAVFIATGAGLPYFMNIPGENLNGVYSANEFLTRTNLMKAYLFPEYLTPIRLGKRVAVIGAGNVAMDSARTALRLGALESYIVYRRSEQEMPARKDEIEHAREEGVQFKLLTSPVEIRGDENGWVRSMICQRFELGEPDESGRRRPVAIPGSEYEMEVDTVIMAIGQGPNPLIGQTTPDLQLNRHGNIVADANTGQTSKPGVFAGGDIVTGAATVIQAMGAGKKAARAIHEYLQNI
ncbi:MAG TPA: NADPH-dependent glutamate synthase [Syntrophomonadaceae bacterium]|nr:NADPH-dependent glutamate synthase [Syntrophomonadaceae bacterium]HOQ10079.1 NADPH-dependent glutamate synthase [Syntrophomonadaceae bacterium]HPU49152.1 NADPH-dependent glutamate synthase [Syntrophomonadaceae bacterium]